MLEVQKMILSDRDSGKFSQSNANWYSVDLSYTPVSDYWGENWS